MVARRAYKKLRVNSLDKDSLIARANREKRALLGLDIAKNEIVACLRWGIGEFERPWCIVNPVEINSLVELCQELKLAGIELVVAMESTGTYGDAVRMALTKANVEVQRVSGKSVSDYKEIFDGVPSQHDGKDAAMIAELCAMGKGTPWPYETPSESMALICHQVRRMDAHQRELATWSGRLEAQMARFWPELSQQVKLNSVAILRMLDQYGSPSAVAQSKKIGAELRLWSHHLLSEAKIESVLHSASRNVGFPMTAQDVEWIQEICGRIKNARSQVIAGEKRLREVLHRDPFWSKYVEAMGAGTLGVILSTVGDPRSYSSSGALLKACGLNLKELSSGKRIGEKAISKRGPSMVRRWLYFWALRAIQKAEMREWYHRFTSTTMSGRNRVEKSRKMKGLICVMRKLMRSTWSSMRQGASFTYAKVIQQVRKGKRRRRKKSQPVRRHA